MNDSVQSLLALCAVIVLGLSLGKVSYRGISLGTSGVVFVALAAGHYGLRIPQGVGSVGIVLFVFCLGLSAGPSFLRMFFRQGKMLGLLAVTIIVSAGSTAWGAAKLMGLSADLAAGLFAGALTSTPALAAASERLPANSDVAVGFGIAYPFGVVGVILFVQLVPRLLPKLQQQAGTRQAELSDEEPITRELVCVKNPGIVGKRLRDVAIISHANCQISRLLVEGQLQPVPSAFRLELGQHLLVVGAKRKLHDVIEVLGNPSDYNNYVLDVERQRRRIVVTSKEMTGNSLKELHLLSRFGVTVTRITRQDIEFVPSPQERINFGDALTVVGEPEGLEKFVQYAGHRERTFDETDVISLAAGLMLGVILGQVELAFNGQSFSLGMAGGPLLVGLAMGHFGRIGPLVGRMPRAARFLLTEIGLALFLAQAGSQAGEGLVSVIQDHGLLLCIAAILIVAVPLLIGLIVARFVMRLGTLESLGGICGAMTSTPGLGAIMSSVDSSTPATSYATVYPLALILVTIVAPLLISQLS